MWPEDWGFRLMLPIAKKSVIRSALLVGASALTLGIGANLATTTGAAAGPGACTLSNNPHPLITGAQTATTAGLANSDLCGLSSSLTGLSTGVSTSISTLSS